MRIGGLASGMDIDQIVKDLMAAEKIPLDKLTQEKAWSEWQQEAYREFNLAFSNLRSSANNLRFSSAFNAYSATSSNSTSIGVVSTSSAMKGTYSIQVDSLASSAKLNSSNAITKVSGGLAQSTDQIGTDGTITVNGSDGSSKSITITAGMTYADVAKSIQDSTAGGVPELRASFDNTTSRFFISSKEMGVEQNFSLTFSSTELANQVVNNGTTNTVMTTNAKDGSIKFDGILIDQLKTNQTTVNGLTINLLQVTTQPATITVQTDTAKPLESIKNFVEQYNKIIADVELKLIEKRYPDFKPLTDNEKKEMSEKEIEMWEEKSRSGLLRNDPLLRGALQDIRRSLMDPINDLGELGNINMLSQIGINTAKDTGGKLFIDEEKLKKALADRPDEVMELFTKDTGNLGIAERVYQELNAVVKNLSNRAGSAGTFVDQSTISKKINQMDEDIRKWQDRLIRVEDRYWKQFTAMEKAMNTMNQQSVWMQSNMFGGM